MKKSELMAHGGAAFPSDQSFSVIDDDGRPVTVKFTGMELRDWFAGQAITGLIAMTKATANSGSKEEKDIIRLLVGQSYLVADAMLAHRGRK